MRIKVPLIGYLLACMAGSGVLGAGMAVASGSAVGFLYLIIVPFFGIIFGAVLALPVAVPTIILTEKWGKGPWWLFLIAGVLTGLMLLILFGWESFMLSGGLIFYATVFATTCSASMTYWWFAWHKNLPVYDFSDDVEAFE